MIQIETGRSGVARTVIHSVNQSIPFAVYDCKAAFKSASRACTLHPAERCGRLINCGSWAAALNKHASPLRPPY